MCALNLPTLASLLSLLCKSAPFSGYSQSFVLKCLLSGRQKHVFEDSPAGGLACRRGTSPDYCNSAVTTIVKMQFQENTTKNGLILDACQDVRGEVTLVIMTLEQLRISVEACQYNLN